MKRETDRQAVISLSEESFKHYLIERYGKQSESEGWAYLRNTPEESIPSEIWLELYQKARTDMERMGGRLIGYELVNDELVSHERLHSKWPANCMWVLQFSHN